ncbi:bifunctional precorrin-2 dehydrogenase/sirohydrochlorin ferrochelatase [uncultured Ruminococcus sp.]|uniref:precorrin-2 dehydrogenase/sirohydrochlorin ferrochelatase family protein n=1 Tax=uncultured Ruminococcus sp. TaxID=165186 RepID=UPI0025D56140|nr:bifunctional precorrin-2 dehydrogenase/sirohydrochlorin ferrochelatase [uncultured Ruminococcus sp.]
MAYFPFYIDIENKNILVVGGGTVALRKIEKLLPFKPSITVVSPKISTEILRLNVNTINREFADGDLENVFCVISATDNEQVNAHIFDLCSAKNILVNTVDDKEKCGFIFPALVQKNSVTVGITTSGKSPIYAKYLKEQFLNMLENTNSDTTETLWQYREYIKENTVDEELRKKVFSALMGMCLCGESIDTDVVNKIIKENS